MGWSMKAQAWSGLGLERSRLNGIYRVFRAPSGTLHSREIERRRGTRSSESGLREGDAAVRSRSRLSPYARPKFYLVSSRVCSWIIVIGDSGTTKKFTHAIWIPDTTKLNTRKNNCERTKCSTQIQVQVIQFKIIQKKYNQIYRSTHFSVFLKYSRRGNLKKSSALRFVYHVCSHPPIFSITTRWITKSIVLFLRDAHWEIMIYSYIVHSSFYY